SSWERTLHRQRTNRGEQVKTPMQMAHVLEQTGIENRLLEAGGQSAYGFDGGATAKERWLAFKSIQDGNFWTDYP
ncbi:hypothetical protein C2I33_18750, partial [Ralstonia solanacearum]